MTQTIVVETRDAVPPGFVSFPFPGPPIYGRAQVLSRRHSRPVFVETDPTDEHRRVAFWVHRSILPELTRWIRRRIFSTTEIFD
jgi:hypothetical protein